MTSIADAAQTRARLGAGRTVLVAEDDDRLRQVTIVRLLDLGFQVLEASNGMTALALLDQHPDVDVLFSDLVMPGAMSGLDLAKRVRDLYPEVRIILTTGYSAELLADADADLGLQVLRKPYRYADLVRAFCEVLGKGPTAGDAV
jgi:CheY-like chemotaxis protein